MKAPDILLVGGGVSGLFSAILLADAGLQVEILERGERPLESSWAGAGILSALPPWGYEPAVTRLIDASLDLWPEWIERLRHTAQTDPEYHVSGMLVLDPTDPQAADAWCRKQGPAPIPAALAELAARHRSAHWLPQVAQARNPRLLSALRECALACGVRILTGINVTGLEQAQGRISGLLTSNGIRRADRYVITAGAWSQILLGKRAMGLDIAPVRGQIVQVQTQPGSVPAIVLTGTHYLVPRQDGLVLIGSTLENAGFDKSVSPAVQATLLAIARKLFPALHDAPVTQHWAGLRPGSPGNIPTIGRHPRIANLYINSGHFRYGVTLGPGAAQRLADEMLGRPTRIEDTPYRWPAA